jgi:GNAT superfamily N-acetyltransferase
MQQVVTISYLEMTRRDQLRPARPAAVGYRLLRCEVPSPELNRTLYIAVGSRWAWYERLAWNDTRWLTYLDRPELETWVAYVAGSPAGYFELERQPGKNVELAYFGLLPDFIGQGLGRSLLTAAVSRAWDMGARRVWVHTCTLDHPHALPNYLARGFQVFRTEEKLENLPDSFSPQSRNDGLPQTDPHREQARD